MKIAKTCAECLKQEPEVKFRSTYNKKCENCYQEERNLIRVEDRKLATQTLAPINLNTTDVRLRWLRAMDKKRESDVWDSLADIPDLILALDSARAALTHMEEWAKEKGLVDNTKKPPRQASETWWVRRRRINSEEACLDTEGYTVAN